MSRGPQTPDLGAVLDEHLAGEFERQDLHATMRTMSPNPYLNHVPVMAGGYGRDEVERFYRLHFIAKWPPDTSFQLISRTVGDDQVVDEVIVSFSHDLEMDALLPGVPPTGRHVRLPHVVVVFEDGKVAHEHIYWDQASLLVQVGLLDPAGLPVTGGEQADRPLDPSLPSNRLMTRPRPGAPPG